MYLCLQNMPCLSGADLEISKGREVQVLQSGNNFGGGIQCSQLVRCNKKKSAPAYTHPHTHTHTPTHTHTHTPTPTPTPTHLPTHTHNTHTKATVPFFFFARGMAFKTPELWSTYLNLYTNEKKCCVPQLHTR